MAAIVYPTEPTALDYLVSPWTAPDGSQWLYDAKGRWEPYVAAVTVDPATVIVASPVNDDMIQRVGGSWVTRTLAQIKTALGLGTAAYTASTEYAAASHTHVSADITDASAGGNGAVDAGKLVTFGSPYGSILASDFVEALPIPGGAAGSSAAIVGGTASSTGELYLGKAATAGMSLRVSNLTDFRNFEAPDASGTLMVETLAGVNASTARTNLGAGTTGADLFQAATVAAAREVLGTQRIERSTASAARNNSNTADTYINDNDMPPLVLTAGKHYEIRVSLMADPIGGFKAQLAIPWSSLDSNNTVTKVGLYNTLNISGNCLTATDGILVALRASTGSTHMYGNATIIISVKVSGSYYFQWAQNVADPGDCILRKCVITCQEL